MRGDALRLPGGGPARARALPRPRGPIARRGAAPPGLPRRGAGLGPDHPSRGGAQPARERADPLRDPGGGGGLDAGGDAPAGQGKLPRLGGPARGGAALPRARGPLRLRLPHPAHRRGDDPGRASRRGARRGGPARLGRGVPPRRRLDRPRRHQRPPLRGGAHPAGLRGAPGAGRAGHRHLRRRGRVLRLLDAGHAARPRGPPDHARTPRRPGRRSSSRPTGPTRRSPARA